MKFLLIFFCFGVLCCSCKSWEDALVENKIARKEKSKKESLLIMEADVHRLLLEQGKLVRDRGTSSPVRDYGDLMVTRETALLSKIEMLSLDENVKISPRLSAKRAQVLNQLRDIGEKDFDKKALKIITTQYKQNLEEIENKISIPDSRIKDLLSYQITITQELRSKIEILKQEQAEKHFSMRARYRAWNRGYMVSLILGQFLI